MTVTTNSNLLNVPTRQIEHNNNGFETTSVQYDPSFISTQNTANTPPPTFLQQVKRTYEPPPLPPQFSTDDAPHNSAQKRSSNMNIAQHATKTQFRQITLRTPQYTLAQTSNVQTSTFSINSIHTNPQTHPTTSSTPSRRPLLIIPNNPLSYNLSTTNINNTQQPSTVPHTRSTTFQMNSLSTSQTPQITSTTIRFNPHIYTTNTCPIFSTQNTHNIHPSSNVNHHTTPSSTLLLFTVSNPTHVKSSASISEPLKPIDGLDRKYTIEEFLQHIETH